MQDINRVVFTLSNGLRVVLENRPGRTTTSCFIGVNVGSRNEREDQAGYAHFIEHMLFKGTKKHNAKKIALEIEKRGGSLNASTGRESTNFFIRLPSISQEFAFKYLSEMFFHPEFPQKELDSERKVVIEEIHTSSDNVYNFLYKKAFQDLYKGHPIAREIIGYEKVIESCSRDSLISFYKQYYVPKNSALSIAGGLWNDEKGKQKVIEQVKKYFNVSVPNAYTPVKFKKAKLQHGKRFTHYKDLEQAYFLIALEGFKYTNYQGFEIDLYNNILGEGMSSRLFQKIRSKLGLCYSIGTFNYTMENEGLFGAICSSKGDPEKAIYATIKELRTSLKGSITKKEFNDAKSALIGNTYVNIDGVHYRAEQNCNTLLAGELIDYNRIIESIKKVTLESTEAFMQKLWKNFDPSVVIVKKE